VSEVLSALTACESSASWCSATSIGRRGEMLRVRRGSYLIADCASVAEVAQLVDLATLVPELRA
jgi:hypothetical protein